MRALLDLLFPASCAGCGEPGAVACRGCRSALLGPARFRMPTPCPPRLPPLYAVADYAGTTRRLLLAYKERDCVALRRPLAEGLSAGLMAAAGPSSPAVLVVPVPSSRAAARRRGFDPVAAMARTAAVAARTAGTPATVVPALAHVRAVGDSAGLSAAERAANLGGALAVRPRYRTGLQGRVVVIADDVVTTGATIAEAARALRAAGAVVVAAATVAATVRRSDLARAGLPNRTSDGYGSGGRPTPAEEAPAWTSS